MLYLELCFLTVKSNGKITNDLQLINSSKEFTPEFVSKGKKVLLKAGLLKEDENNQLYVDHVSYQ